MARVAGREISSLDRAVLRGWARGRSHALVLGPVERADAIADLVPITTLEPVTLAELSEHVRVLDAGALIVNAGARRFEAMRTIRREASVPMTVLWSGYAHRFRDHRIEAEVVPSRLIDRWAVFELPGPAAAG